MTVELGWVAAHREKRSTRSGPFLLVDAEGWYVDAGPDALDI